MEKQNLLKNISIFMFGIIGSKLILFFMLPLYTYTLLPNEFGTAEIVFTTVQLIMPVFSLAIYNGELRYGLSVNYDRNQVAKCTFFVVAFASLIILFVSPILCMYKPLAHMELFLALYAISLLFNNVSLIYLKIQNMNKLYSVFGISQTFFLALFNVLFLVIYKLGVEGYIVSFILSNFFIAALACFSSGFYRDIFKTRLDRQLLLKMCSYSAPFVLNDISWWAIHASDKYMLASMLNFTIVGIYTAASKIPSLVNSFSSVFSQAWVLSAVQEYEKNKINKKYFEKVFRNYYIVMYLITFTAIIFSQKFTSLYLSESYNDAGLYVPILLLSILFGGISNYTTSIFSALEKSQYIMYTTLLSALLNILLNYLWIPVYGAFGACLATLVTYLFLMVYRMYIVNRLIQLDFDTQRFGISTILLFLQVLIILYNIHIITLTICIAIVLLMSFRVEIKKACLYLRKKIISWREYYHERIK